MRLRTVLGSSAVAILCGLNIAGAAVVTNAGTVASSSEFTDWRSTGTAKSLDADGNNSYGSAGFAWWETGGYNSGGAVGGNPFTATAYTGASSKTFNSPGITYANIGMDKSFFGFGYPSFDDPTQPVSPSVGDVLSGVAGFSEGTSTGVSHDAFSISIDSAYTGGDLRLGFWGPLGSGNYVASSVALRQTVGGLTSATYSTAGEQAYFFDIVAPQAGDVYVLSLEQDNLSANGAITFSGFTLDAAPAGIPEPACLSVLGLGGITLLKRRRS